MGEKCKKNQGRRHTRGPCGAGWAPSSKIQAKCNGLNSQESYFEATGRRHRNEQRVLPDAAVSFTHAGETSSEFTGHHVNSGTVSHEVKTGRHVLTMSRGFPLPEAPDPHWRVVDSKGNVFLLDRVKIKDEKINSSITLPPYVRDVARVQFWCAFVEVVLGEASFAKPGALHSAR